MEPQHLIRTIQRRWRPVVFLAVVGAALGAASAAVAEDAGPAPVPTTYYDACHRLLVDSAIPNNVEQWDVRNLAQLAQRLTQGEIPVEVAASVGAPVVDVASQVRVAVRNDVQSVSVCTVGATPAEAEQLADEYARQLLVFLDAEAREFHQERLTRAAEQVSNGRTCVRDAEAEMSHYAEFDYLIGAVHYIAPGWDIDNPKHLSRWSQSDVTEVWQHYWDTYTACVRSGRFDVIRCTTNR